MNSYRFASFVLNVGERRLLRNGEAVALTPKVFDTLVYLVERHGHLVRKDEVIEAIWGGSFVEEGSLPRTIHVLRKALAAADGASEPPRQYVETVPTKGYRFVMDVTPVDDTASRGRAQSPAPSTAVTDTGSPPESGPARGAGTRLRRGAALVAACALPIMVLTGMAWRARDGHAAVPAGSGRLTLHTISGAAYSRFQSGRLHLERHLAGDTQAALADFEAAIRLDPGFAAAYAGKADAKFFSYWDTGSHDDIAQARLAIRKALELDDRSGYAHSLHCRLLATYDWDLAGAEAECRRAVDLDAGSDTARRELAFLLGTLGRRDEALREMDAAVAIAPTSFNKRSRGRLLYFNRRFDEAVAQLQQVEATDPEYSGASRWIARCLEQKRDYKAALEAWIRHRQSAGAPLEAIASLRGAFEGGGWPGVLRASLAHQRPTPDLETAGTYAQLGDPDAAFAVLESMISARRVMIVHMDSEPRLDPLRGDPRFDELARRVGLR
jgi:DNA-binding winged helix-turn-helix (wHTH) protein/Tfp pilus assembly protein PilF